MPHPTLGSIKMQNVAPRASRTPGRVNWPGPALGAHTDEIMGDLLGLTDAQIAEAQGGR